MGLFNEVIQEPALQPDKTAFYKAQVMCTASFSVYSDPCIHAHTLLLLLLLLLLPVTPAAACSCCCRCCCCCLLVRAVSGCSLLSGLRGRTLLVLL